MASRETILNTLRAVPRTAAPLPELDGGWTTYEDPAGQFADVLQAVGGRLLPAADLADMNRQLQQLEVCQAAGVIRSAVSGVVPEAAAWPAGEDPHALEDTDVCIVPGQFAVAENGAVWVEADALPHPAALFVTQHLVLVVPAAQIVHNMHEAYDRLNLLETRLGIFISGPSKTADIEQSLVIGAHGARSLTVFLVREAGAR